ncbi:MAG: PAS domain S-box protein [Caldilineaceae bacterium]
MLWITDATGYCTFPAAAGMNLQANWKKTGWATADYSVHPDDDSHAHETFLAANGACHRSFRTDCRLRRADGSYGWAIDTGHPRFDADGSFLGHIGAVIDIHERKEAEEALRCSEERVVSLSL